MSVCVFVLLCSMAIEDGTDTEYLFVCLLQVVCWSHTEGRCQWIMNAMQR